MPYVAPSTRATWCPRGGPSQPYRTTSNTLFNYCSQTMFLVMRGGTKKKGQLRDFGPSWFHRMTECVVCYSDERSHRTVRPLCCAPRAPASSRPRRPVCPYCLQTALGYSGVCTHVADLCVALDYDDASRLGMSLAGVVSEGVTVTSVDPDGCARRHGVRLGDVITHLNDVPVVDPVNASRVLDGNREARRRVHCSLLRQRRRGHCCWMI